MRIRGKWHQNKAGGLRVGCRSELGLRAKGACGVGRSPGPPYPSSQTHALSTQLPRGQPHSSSVQPGVKVAQSGPLHRSSHTQLPPMHKPCVPQSAPQAGEEQAVPVQPGQHAHLPSLHSPRPEQPSGHERMWQSIDSHPSSHWHTLFTHAPRPEQLFGHCRSAQPSPVHR